MRSAKFSKIVIFTVCILLVFAVAAALLFDGASLPATDSVIADSGEGADEANQEMVGTGIGLSLVLSIVKLHQGVVWVEDNQPKGAAFHVLIPIDKEAYSREQWVEDSAPSERDDTKEHPEENAAPAPLPGPRRTLLLAEDNAEVRRYVKARLEPYYEVLEAGDGVEAFNSWLPRRCPI